MATDTPDAAPAAQKPTIISDRWHHVASGVPAAGVVVPDVLGPALRHGGEVPNAPQLELHGRVPRFDHQRWAKAQGIGVKDRGWAPAELLFKLKATTGHQGAQHARS